MDPKGKIIVITGATSGLGQAAAIEFARRGARVLIVGRDAARAEETRAAAAAQGGQAEVVLGDVSTRAGANALGAAILARAPAIDVLINNAGGQFKSLSKTADGIETTFALNTVGAFVLERALHAALAKQRGRVVNVATGLLNSFPLDADDIAAPKKFSGMSQYGRSKLASVMMTVEQSTRLASDGITVVSLHPGIIMGTRFNGGQPKLVQMIAGPIMRAIGVACTLEQAVAKFVAAAFDDVPSGSYMVNGKPAPLPKQAADVQVRSKILGLLDKLAAA